MSVTIAIEFPWVGTEFFPALLARSSFSHTMNGATLLALSRKGPSYGKVSESLKDRCLAHLQTLIGERATKEAESQPTAYFAQVYSDDFRDLHEIQDAYDGENGEGLAGPVFEYFLQKYPHYQGFTFSLYANEDGPRICVDWLEATEGLAGELRRKRDEAVAALIPASEREQVIAQGVQYVREETFENERQRHLSARAKQGYTTATFCQAEGIYEAGEAGEEGASNFPLEVMRAFVQQYPEIEGIKIVLRGRELVADWSEATGEPSAIDADSDLSPAEVKEQLRRTGLGSG
jgi:hypothetical protein